MGWRERDYAKFTDEEFAAIYGASARHTGSIVGSPPGDGSGSNSRPRRRRGGGFMRALRLLGISVVATAIIFGGAIVTGRVPTGTRHSSGLFPMPIAESAPQPTPVITPVPQPTNVVGIRWRTIDLAPAAAAGRICVTDSQHGRTCASYVAGERPADTLSRELAARGLQVESEGGG